MKKLTDELITRMLELAVDAQSRAYTPYSHFRVGACLLTDGGHFYQGCNIENAAYTPTICAERTTVFKAVSEGEREFSALAIVWDGNDPAMPCGVCRQVLAEFCPMDMPVICGKKDATYVIYALSELLPGAFLPKDLV